MEDKGKEKKEVVEEEGRKEYKRLRHGEEDGRRMKKERKHAEGNKREDEKVKEWKVLQRNIRYFDVYYSDSFSPNIQSWKHSWVILYNSQLLLYKCTT